MECKLIVLFNYYFNRTKLEKYSPLSGITIIPLNGEIKCIYL